MAMTACAECTKEISDKASACPHCGAKKKTSKTWLYVLLGVPVAFLGFGAVVGNSPEGKVRSGEQGAIEQCWSEQRKTSNDPATARFIAGACEKMEQDYTSKHGRKP